MNTDEAKQEMIRWLAYPTELGYEPKEIHLLDHRILKWPPNRSEIPVWLFRYRVECESGISPTYEIGMVGHITFSLMSYRNAFRPIEDIYALHLIWELETQESLLATNSFDRDSTLSEQYASICPTDITIERLTHILLLMDSQEWEKTTYVVVEGTQNSGKGHIVIDGEKAFWYPLSRFPNQQKRMDSKPDPLMTLKIHVGRQLLGFPCDSNLVSANDNDLTLARQNVDRAKAAWDRALADLDYARIIFRKYYQNAFAALIADHHLVEPRREIHELVIEHYWSLLNLAYTYRDDESNPLENFNLLTIHFDWFAKSLVIGQQKEMACATIHMMLPYWQFKDFGSLAYGIHEVSWAEELCLSSFHRENWAYFPEVDVLAKIYMESSRVTDAEELLIRAIRTISDRFQTANESDQKWLQEHATNRMNTYFELFPNRSYLDLNQHGIPIEVDEEEQDSL